jgi:hypothetical protein
MSCTRGTIQETKMIVTVKIEETTDGDGWAMSIGNGKQILGVVSAQAALSVVQRMGKKLPGTAFQIEWRPVTRQGTAAVQFLRKR